MWSAVLLALALQAPVTRDTLTVQDSTAIQKAARDHLKYDAPVARLVSVRGDTVFVHVGNRVSWTQVRVERREGRWVARKDSVEVRGIR